LAASSVCIGDIVSLALSRHLERAQILLARAAETTHDKKANRLVTRAMGVNPPQVRCTEGEAARRGTQSLLADFR